MSWSFDQWVIVVGLVIAFVGATVPVAVELTRRVRASRSGSKTEEIQVVEIEEQFLDHLVQEIADQGREIAELKQTIVALREEKTRIYRQRDAAHIALASAGIPIPFTGD